MEKDCIKHNRNISNQKSGKTIKSRHYSVKTQQNIHTKGIQNYYLTIGVHSMAYFMLHVVLKR